MEEDKDGSVFIVQSVIQHKEKSGQGWEAGTEAETGRTLLTGLFSIPYSVCFSYTTQDTCPGVTMPIVDFL